MVKITHKEKTFEQRLKESTQILQKYPDKICVYIEKVKNCETIPNLDKNKYLVPKIISVSQFIYVIRNRIEIPKDKGLFFYANNNIISGTSIMSQINDKYKDADGFLYIKYGGESCFG